MKFANIKPMPPGDPNQKPASIKEYNWLMTLLNVFAREWSTSPHFKVLSSMLLCF